MVVLSFLVVLWLVCFSLNAAYMEKTAMGFDTIMEGLISWQCRHMYLFENLPARLATAWSAAWTDGLHMDSSEDFLKGQRVM